MELTTPLTEQDIECRIGSVSAGKGFAVLLYKTARIDRKRLDDVYGPLGWQCKFYNDVAGLVVCRIGIKSQNEWIWKENVGVESQTEKEKGSYSDAFKRAGFMWGIGVELYDTPFMWIPWTNFDGKRPVGVFTKNWKVKFSGQSILDPFTIYDGNKVIWSNAQNLKANDFIAQIDKIGVYFSDISQNEIYEKMYTRFRQEINNPATDEQRQDEILQEFRSAYKIIKNQMEEK